ncbi:hypothetical protein TPB0596_15220 [Tsukamurella pulmonis]|uniref:Low affinity iron permease n=1 Tax=Tsukamurella pulmonis TaxID=47312 RepID=A0A1H1GJL1_9ACTN|nr:hypothetical protein TPB0596_15220 [Tsukamurella pulmonis]SDR13404.1 Low affinity iron permease [Tsukamurella pulmonis]SUP17164.1 Predicted small integral membrane protein [Tsukamurella pulmonis]
MTHSPREEPATAGPHGAPPSAASDRESTSGHRPPLLPGSVDGRVSVFDRFADWTGRWVSRAWFFSFCVVLVVIWAPSILVLRNVDTWQLVINTATTIITFLLVALVQNQSTRADAAIQQKLNALIEAALDQDPGVRSETVRRQLDEAIGVERRESS